MSALPGIDHGRQAQVARTAPRAARSKRSSGARRASRAPRPPVPAPCRPAGPPAPRASRNSKVSAWSSARRQGDRRDPPPRRSRRQPRVARVAGRALATRQAFHATQLATEAPGRTARRTGRRVRGRAGVEAVIEVGRHHGVTQARQRVQEHRRVRAAGEGHEDRLARRQQGVDGDRLRQGGQERLARLHPQPPSKLNATFTAGGALTDKAPRRPHDKRSQRPTTMRRRSDGPLPEPPRLALVATLVAAAAGCGVHGPARMPQAVRHLMPCGPGRQRAALAPDHARRRRRAHPGRD